MLLILGLINRVNNVLLHCFIMIDELFRVACVCAPMIKNVVALCGNPEGLRSLMICTSISPVHPTWLR